MPTDFASYPLVRIPLFLRNYVGIATGALREVPSTAQGDFISLVLVYHNTCILRLLEVHHRRSVIDSATESIASNMAKSNGYKVHMTLKATCTTLLSAIFLTPGYTSPSSQVNTLVWITRPFKQKRTPPPKLALDSIRDDMSGDNVEKLMLLRRNKFRSRCTP